jgi:hypothetical protein
MDDAELEAVLQALRSKNVDGTDHCRFMLEAWALFALGRRSEGLQLTERAARVWQLNRAGAGPHGGSIFWEPCIARAAVALSEQQWRRATDFALQVLRDFDEEDEALRLWGLAVHAQGERLPARLDLAREQRARELAEFDLRAYAVQHLESSSFARAATGRG